MSVALPRPLKLLVVDDHPIVREGVAALVADRADLRVAGSAEDAAQAVAEARRHRPDLILLDLRLPGLKVPETIRRLRDAAPRARIVVFTAHAEPWLLNELHAAGLEVLLHRQTTGADLVDRLVRIAVGERVVDPPLRMPAPAVAGRSPVLTPREHEVLRHVAVGRTNPEIAEVLHLSRNTVKTYLQTALQKLGARNRVEAILRASEQGLL